MSPSEGADQLAEKPVEPAVVPPALPANLQAEFGDDRVPLRLTATRGALGIELYEPIEVGPFEVKALAATLPGLKFPLDLSGGVPLFRHRRGDLERLELTLGLDRLGRWLTPRLENVLGALERRVQIWSVSHGIGVGLSGSDGALAFDFLFAPIHGDARWVIAHARGAGLGGPALGHALRAVDTALGAFAERRGRIVTIRGAAAHITRAVLPAIGARAPATSRVRFGDISIDGDLIEVALDSTFAPPLLHATAARALELAELTREFDDALAVGNLDGARTGYMNALEQAPRHPEIARLIAEIDVIRGGRSEAALGLLVETISATQAGLVGAELLASIGDFDGAGEAISAAANGEPFAPLAALSWLRLSELEASAPARLDAIDRAVAAAPGLSRVRWARFFSRLDLGDVGGSIADAEHLEAAAEGARARHEVTARAARAVLERGFVRDAGKLFERALRYLPDDAAATAGLARSMMEAGKSHRAFALLSRAVTLADKAGRPDNDALIDMGRLLASDLRDLPQAIARVRQVPATSSRGAEARVLEGEWRAALGDVAGASLAYARLRDAIVLADETPANAAKWLMQAARFEREVQDDVLSAERHLAVALRIAPQDATVADAYREVAAVVAARARRERERGREPEPAPIEPRERPETLDEPLQEGVPETIRPGENAEAIDQRVEDLELAERLESALRADPDDPVRVRDLLAVLERLGRDRELYALLSARLEHATEAERRDLLPAARAVLGRLSAAALKEGRPDEALLYRIALDRLS